MRWDNRSIISMAGILAAVDMQDFACHKAGLFQEQNGIDGDLGLAWLGAQLITDLPDGQISDAGDFLSSPVCKNIPLRV
jgi:hypothetical protein